jgi:hypothetical protein
VKYRFVVTCIVLVIAGGSACGGSSQTEVATETAAPHIGPGGPILRGLTAGRQVLAPDGRYSLYVPAEWLELNVGLAEVSFRSPEANSVYQVSVTREQLDGIRQPQVYAEAGRRGVSRVYQNVLTLSMSPVQVGEVAAYRWVYTATTAGRDQMFYQLFVIDGGEGYVVTGSAPVTTEVSQMQALFDSIAGSLSFARG